MAILIITISAISTAEFLLVKCYSVVMVFLYLPDFTHGFIYCTLYMPAIFLDRADIQMWNTIETSKNVKLMYIYLVIKYGY